MSKELRAILERVKTLFAKYGIKSMTMDDVARELGMSKKTLYQHIKTKDDLVWKVIGLMDEEYEKIFKEIKSKEPDAIQSLIWVNRLVYRMIKEYNPSFEYDLKKYHPEIFHYVRKQSLEKMYNTVVENIRQGKSEGLYRDNVDEILIAKLYASRVNSLMESDLITPEEKMNPEFKNQIMEYHIRGIANDKGIIKFEEYLKHYND